MKPLSEKDPLDRILPSGFFARRKNRPGSRREFLLPGRCAF
jgi:hypothetical protein